MQSRQWNENGRNVTRSASGGGQEGRLDGIGKPLAPVGDDRAEAGRRGRFASRNAGFSLSTHAHAGTGSRIPQNGGRLSAHMELGAGTAHGFFEEAEPRIERESRRTELSEFN